MKWLSLAVVLLARLGTAAPAASSVYVRFELIRESSEISLTIVDAATKKALGRSCSAKLDSGKFANWPVSINLDTSGQGNITLGTNTQPMEYNLEPAASVSCDSISDEKAVFISCKVSVPAGVDLTPAEDIETSKCLSDERASLATVADAMAAGGNADGPPIHAPTGKVDGAVNSTDIDINGKRQTNPCSQWTPDVRRIGDGDPWQHHLYTQLSEPTTCDGRNPCSATFTESRGWSFGANINGAAKWISGGFSVAYSVTSGNSYSCNGGGRDTVCVWYDQAFTEYKVVSGSRNGCGTFSPSFNTKISSPNQNNRGGKMYCVSGGHCRGKSDRYWQLYTRRGGP